jgi:hypothetical protein
MVVQRWGRFAFAFALVFGLMACGSSHLPADGGADAGRDAGESCGRTTCAASEVCCSSCDGDQFCSVACPDVPCPVGCGGFGGIECGADEYCDYVVAGSPGCGPDDGAGVCVRRPDLCMALYDPVCGCDGVDYPGPCEARAAGQDVAGFGMCGSAVLDCRLTGCSARESCIVCGPPGTGYSCVMDGAVCGL